MATSYHVLTGGTSGMGLYIAAALGSRPECHLIVGARKPEQANQLRAAVPLERLTLLQVDLGSLKSTMQFAEQVAQCIGDVPIDSVICNAGLQLIGGKQLTAEGFESTFVTNYLSHFLLVRQLNARLSDNAAVVTVGSGTHNADDKLATRFGFRGACVPDDLRRLSTGDLGRDGNDVQQGMDRYATSKLCAILIAKQMALQPAERAARYYCFEPGLMPGTQLARQRSLLERFGWTYVMPLLRHLLRGISTSQHSGEALVKECVVGRDYPSGSYVEFSGKYAPESSVAQDATLAKALYELSTELIGQQSLHPV